MQPQAISEAIHFMSFIHFIDSDWTSGDGAGCFLPTVLSTIISTMPLAKVACGSVPADPCKIEQTQCLELTSRWDTQTETVRSTTTNTYYSLRLSLIIL